MPSKLLFLPGASGDTQFWLPVVNSLTYPAEKVYLEWPELGSIPSDPKVNSMHDLVDLVAAEVDQPVAIIAQSIGGIIAIQATLKKPELITHLVLAATSGGIDMESFGAQDWRPIILAAHPSFPRLLSEYDEDLTPQLHKIKAPTLLLWGDADPISPVSVGLRLATLLPNANLHIVPGGDHNLVMVHAKEIAPLIDAHLAKSTLVTSQV
ncbi:MULTISPECIES: alpha/beta fold hydrolase [Nitrosomonas]|uniref:Alpha/beta hydrolase n=1 Tax=Nitrosomonas communis TaxID=44574 RepID=A0A0F7KJ35_9PROT|nr:MULTISPECIES: alpha/beta hydrolase [Nitrosomonas]AKH39113.1 alpha/beta hydrolase [Nitrosomonas communis]TYP91249.1 alpha/beta hydrolase family protein [Nitrosomonas communis]UVS61286.1 alpha/beta hydrolase [Nitrosomonas sp. PLL12]